jgi:hypothetical protein
MTEPLFKFRTIDGMAAEIKEWADVAFPGRTDSSMYLKLYSEVAEMIEADDEHVGPEVADVFIMLLDFAKRRNINIQVAIDEKMAINRGREWVVNRLGAWSHVKEKLS